MVQFDHETDEPPVLIARSLTDLLAGRRASAGGRRKSAKRPANEPRVYVSSDKKLPENLLTAAEIYIADEHFDLTLLLGARARLVEFSDNRTHTVADARPLMTLANLEYLSAPPSVWRVILDQNAVPAHLVTLTLTDDRDTPLAEQVALGNALLAHFGKSPVEFHQTTVQ